MFGNIMTAVSLPYYADPCTLPATLPTIEDIEISEDVIHERFGAQIVGVGKCFVVKYGYGVNLMEGVNMTFVREATSVPVPRCYALFTDSTTGKSYHIMERIQGERLDLKWDSLSDTDKDLITQKLRGNLEELRSLPSPGGYCSLGHRGLLDGMFCAEQGLESIQVPFDTESQLNEAMIKRYILSDLPPRKADFYRLIFASVFKDHPPVFTHADLQGKNILLRKRKSTESFEDNSKHDLELVIIDWEAAGWYPTYWEWARAIFACGLWKDDWCIWLRKVLDPYVTEWAIMHMLFMELWS